MDPLYFSIQIARPLGITSGELMFRHGTGGLVLSFSLCVHPHLSGFSGGSLGFLGGTGDWGWGGCLFKVMQLKHDWLIPKSIG